MATKAKPTPAEAARKRAVSEIEGKAVRLRNKVALLALDPTSQRDLRAAMKATREVGELLAAFAAIYEVEG